MKSVHTTIKLISTIILVITINVNANNFEITTDTDLGQSILRNARRLNGGGGAGGGGNGENDNNKSDYTWMARYSLKFLGCNNIQKWNTNADSYYYPDEDRIITSRVVRFRLCPTNICKKNNHNGCGRGYGDYVVDMDSYVSAYVEAQRRQDEYKCNLYVYKKCNCQNADDMDLCEYKCFMRGRKYNCINNNPYYDDDTNTEGVYQNNLNDFQKYFEACTEFNPYYSSRRRLEDTDEGDGGSSHYIGSYCSDQGGNVYLGMFTDSSCTNFADKNAGRTTYKSLTGGDDLPYSSSSMIKSECISCLEGAKPQNQNDGNYGHVSGNCKDVYKASGKCETEMSNQIKGPSVINKNACYYIEGLKIVRKDGILDTTFTRPNKVMSSFIFMFAVSFVLLGAFIYYLRMSE